MSRPGAATLAACLALLAGAVEPEEAQRPTEYEVKAAYLFHFAKFVKWPEDATPGQSFVIAVLGGDPFGEVLDRTVAGKAVLDRKVEVRRMSALEAPGDIQILFVASSERLRLPHILKTLEGASILTVAEMEGFVERGGMMAFRLSGETVRFDINLDQVERARLKMSSQLIRLARHVISKGDGL